MGHAAKRETCVTISLREYVEAMFAERDKAVHAALESNERRLDALNELRADVATKTQLDAVNTRVNDLKERMDRMSGRSSGLSDGWGWVAGALGLLLAGASFLVHR